jgi:hypothetical protein
MRPTLFRPALLAAAALTALPLVAAAQDRGAPPPHAREGRPAWNIGVPEPVAAPKVFFLNIRDGQVFDGPVDVQFGLIGMLVKPAGHEEEGTGHHHLLIDAAAEDLAPGEPIPADDNHLHFGGGDRDVLLLLGPGEHTLQLVMADHNHVPFDPPVASDRITITVR